MHTDMRHYWITPKDTSRPWFVQVEHVEDISQPAKRRYVANSTCGGGGNSRLLKLMVFDGRHYHAAIEHVHVPFGAGWPRLGSKLLIDAGAISRDGVFLLTPGTCGVLGGAVDEFEARQRVFDEVLQEPVYGRRGPPLRLEAYMEGVKEKVRVHFGVVGGGEAGGGCVPPAGEAAVKTSALNASDRNKRGGVDSFEEQSSDDDFGDVAKRQKQDGSGSGMALVLTQPTHNVNDENDDVVIDLLSSDDE